MPCTSPVSEPVQHRRGPTGLVLGVGDDAGRSCVLAEGVRQQGAHAGGVHRLEHGGVLGVQGVLEVGPHGGPAGHEVTSATPKTCISCSAARSTSKARSAVSRALVPIIRRLRRVAEQALEVACHRGDVTGRCQQPVVAVRDRLRDAPDVGGDDREPRPERLDDDVRHAVAVPVRGDERGDREDVGARASPRR